MKKPNPTNRQHIVPCFSLRGFASKPGDNDYFTWKHTAKDSKELYIPNVGVVRHFYDDPGDDALERTIRAEEGDGLVGFVEAMRGASPGPLSDGATAARLIVHLMARGVFIRHFVDMLLNTFLGSMIEAVEHLTPSPAAQASAMAKQAVEDARAKSETPIEDPAAVTATVESVLFELCDGIRKARREGMREAQPRIAPEIKKLHVDLLRKFLPLPKTFQSEWGSAQWSLIRPTEPAILGDTCAVWFSEDLTSSQPFIVGETTPSIVCLPISSDRVIVGSLRSPFDPNLVAAGLNVAVAEVSSEFFVAANDLPKHRDARARIGMRLRHYADLVRGWLGEVVQQFKDQQRDKSP